MLSIGEAAKLIGVCENTLTDWDIESKLKATRTPGGHRLYTLDQVRAYIDKHPQEKDSLGLVPKGNDVDDIVRYWEKSGHLADLATPEERKALAIILENVRLLWTIPTPQTHAVLSTDQAVWLTHQGWIRSKLRKMVSVQPLMGPCGLVYYTNLNKGNLVLTSDAVIAKTMNLGFSLFTNGDFEVLKDIYADTLATNIDKHIVENLGKTQFNVILDAVRAGVMPACDIDYVIVPNKEPLVASGLFDRIDIYEIPACLDPVSFDVISVMGKYPTTNLKFPVFCPYLLLSEGASTFGGTTSLMMRCGWLSEPSA